jgi:hypothetical protein
VVRFVTAPNPTGFAPAPATDGADTPQPSSPPTLARPATLLPGSGPGKATGKGHAKHGKGHAKHGETDGAHSPGHGQGKGNPH